jgi:hypothetical protein
MSRSDDRKLLALVKKNAAKAAVAKPKPRPTYDETLPPAAEPEDAEEHKQFFKDMKRREF